MNFIINLEKDDTIEDLKVALDQLSELSFDLDAIIINSYRGSVTTLPKNPIPNVTTIYNETGLSHNGGLRP